MNQDIVKGCASKKRYRTQQRADDVAAKCAKERGVNLRSYYCGICGGYHLTKRKA